MTRILFFCLLVFAFSSCKKDETPVPTPLSYSQGYTVVLNLDQNQTEVRADFWPSTTANSNGADVLPSGYWVSCDSVSMPMYTSSSSPSTPSTGPGHYYAGVIHGIVDARFLFHKKDGLLLQNTVLANELAPINFDSAFTSVSKSDSLPIRFTGGPRDSTGSISVSIWQSQQHFTYTMAPLALGDSVCILRPSDMSNLQPGQATIYLERVGPTHPLEQGDGSSGGSERLYVRRQRTINITN